jgi:hypothetical protein
MVFLSSTEIGYVYGSTNKLQGVSTWLHVLAVISRLRRVLCQPQPALRSCHHCPSPLHQHRVRAAGATTSSVPLNEAQCNGVQADSDFAHLYLHHALAVIEGQNRL